MNTATTATNHGTERTIFIGGVLLAFSAIGSAQKLELAPTPDLFQYSTIADFDGDGIADLIDWVGGAGRGMLVFRPGDGRGAFGPEVLSPSYGDYFAGSHFAPDAFDIDHDGLPDVVHVIANRIILQHGLGGGLFNVPFVAHTYWPDYGFLTAFGPIDAVDDEADFIFDNVLYRGDGAGQFHGQPFIDELVYGTYSAVVANVDGDDIKDVVVWSDRGGGALIAHTLLGGPRGGLHLVWSGERTLEGDPRIKLAVGDVSGDGHADLVFTALETSDLFIALGDGTGAFLETHLTHFDLVRAPHDLDLVDLDLDGTLDVVATLRLRRLAIVRTDGAGGFVEPRYVTTDVLSKRTSVTDVDGDGLPDLVVYPSGSSYQGVFLLNRTERVREAR